MVDNDDPIKEQKRRLERGLREGWITRGEDRPPEQVTRHQPVAGTRSTTELIRADRDASP